MRRDARSPWSLGLSIVIAMLWACGSDTEPDLGVARVALQPEHPSVGVGQTVQMSATAFDAADQPIPNTVARWQVGDASRATVSTSGLVTGVAVGSTTVSATIGGVSGSTDVTVTEATPSLATLGLAPEALKLAPGRAGRLVATARNFNGDLVSVAVTWTAGDPAVASVDGQGVVTAHTQGSTTVTASAQGLTASATVSVDPLFTVASLEITPTSATVTVDDTVRFQAVARDARGDELPGQLVAWSVAGQSVATVSQDGLASGTAAGETAIRATVEGLSADARLTVLPPLIGSRARLRDASSTPTASP